MTRTCGILRLRMLPGCKMELHNAEEDADSCIKSSTFEELPRYFLLTRRHAAAGELLLARHMRRRLTSLA